MVPAIFTRRRRPSSTPSTAPPPAAVALPPLSGTGSSSSSPRLPPLQSLPPLVTPGYPPVGPVTAHTSIDDAGAESPSSLSHDESSGSFSHASVATTTGRRTTSTRPSSVDDDGDDLDGGGGDPLPRFKAATVFPTVQRRRPSRVPVPAVDTPAALLAALDLGEFPSLVAPPSPPQPQPEVRALPPSAQELVVQAQAKAALEPTAPSCQLGAEGDDVAGEGCGCDMPDPDELDEEDDDEDEGELEGDEEASADDDDDDDAERDDDEFDSDDELAAEAEDLILQAQAHFNSPFPTAHFLAEQSRRPSLPLPAIPLARRPSAFAEQGLAPLPEDRVLEARDGGLVGASSSSVDEGLTTATDGEKRRPRRRPNKLVKKRRPGVTTLDGTTKKKRKERRPRPQFERFKVPTIEDMATAAACDVVGEDGETHKFGDLIKANGPRRTVVVFLRHAWCGLCAQYVDALNKVTVNLVSLETSAFCQPGDRTQPMSHVPELNIVFVNSGSPKLIATYRQRMKTPFPLYTNRARDLYKALGMNKKTWDMGKDSDKGSYIVKSQLGNVTSSISAGIAMPSYPGSQTQLGGEFVFEYSPEDDYIECLYASRMHTTRGHAEISDVFSAAGVELNAEDAASVYGF
ncbi:uncharacterized protein RHOBADRAFT_47409 [Rhodotorula graminis WP1]|uniref:Thioredoxin domain-containing protein n=1 Tax=Rhodotorula graminis (strain WP1) TaxID=578459 RepID=A0A0P9GGG8_RHOGW|nr:uncharacterized protein RHOBADRAFT_47409 [Rhodotorula graminis WP1]KPV71959.1 hypothetical protein RHOBADRAFT_47409 [Rhodotorula graminis WP1]